MITGRASTLFQGAEITAEASNRESSGAWLALSMKLPDQARVSMTGPSHAVANLIAEAAAVGGLVAAQLSLALMNVARDALADLERQNAEEIAESGREVDRLRQELAEIEAARVASPYSSAGRKVH